MHVSSGRICIIYIHWRHRSPRWWWQLAAQKLPPINHTATAARRSTHAVAYSPRTAWQLSGAAALIVALWGCRWCRRRAGSGVLGGSRSLYYLDITHTFARMGSVWSRSYTHVCPGGIGMIYSRSCIHACFATGEIYLHDLRDLHIHVRQVGSAWSAWSAHVSLDRGSLYDLDLAYMFAQ